jgi:cyanophycinase
MKFAKGKLVIIGGREDKGNQETMPEVDLQKKNALLPETILHRILTELSGPQSRIEIITAASEVQDEVGKIYQQAFGRIDSNNLGIVHLKNAEEANNPEILERLQHAEAVFFSGGDQTRLTHILNSTLAIRIIQERYRDEEKFLVAGTSAGAMCMSQLMIQGSSESHPLAKGNVELGTGLGFIQKMVIDTHFITRGRFYRLLEAIAAYPDHIGVGLGEDTAVLITGNSHMETIGSGLVVTFDGRKLTENNYSEIINGDLICLENLITTILPKGRVLHIQKGILY